MEAFQIIIWRWLNVVQIPQFFYDFIFRSDVTQNLRLFDTQRRFGVYDWHFKDISALHLYTQKLRSWSTLRRRNVSCLSEVVNRIWNGDKIMRHLCSAPSMQRFVGGEQRQKDVRCSIRPEPPVNSHVTNYNAKNTWKLTTVPRSRFTVPYWCSGWSLGSYRAVSGMLGYLFAEPRLGSASEVRNGPKPIKSTPKHEPDRSLA